MNLPGRYIINGQSFSKKKLVEHSEALCSNANREEWEVKLHKFIVTFLGEDKIIQQKSSGTTGDPKNFLLSKEAMLHSAAMTIRHFELQKNDAALLCLPVDYIAGKMMVVRAFLGEMDLITLKPDGDPLTKLDRTVDFAAMVPLQVAKSLENNRDLSLIKKLIIGGGEIHQGLRKKLAILKHTELYETFAMTETYSHFATRRLNGPLAQSEFTLLEGVEIEVDAQHKLTVKIPGVTSSFVASDDLVERKGMSSFVWLGRSNLVIKSGGLKIIPELLERKLGQELGIEGIIMAKKDERLGEKIILVLEEKERKEENMHSKKMENIFTKKELPKEIIYVSSFPRNASYKVNRNKLKELIF